MVPLVRPRSHSLFSVTDNPVIVVDEPEQTAAAAERFWKRLEENAVKMPRRTFTPGRSWSTVCRFGRTRPPRTRAPYQQPTTSHQQRRHDSVAAVSAFHGNIQAAVAEARNLVEQGYRVVFFGRIQRRTRAARGYFPGVLSSLPIGPRSRRRHSPVSGRTFLCRGCVREHVPGQGTDPPRRRVSRPRASPSSDRKTSSIRPTWSRSPARQNPNWPLSPPTWRT